MTRTPGNPQPIALAKIIMAVAGIVLNVTPIAFWAAPSKIVFHLALLVRGGVYEVILLVTCPSHSRVDHGVPISEDPTRLKFPANLIDKPQNQQKPKGKLQKTFETNLT